MNQRQIAAKDEVSNGLETAFRAAIDLCDDAICLILPDGEVVFANRALLSLLQRRPDQAGRQSIWDWLPAVEEPSFRNQLTCLARGKAEVATFASRFLAADGSQVPVDVRIGRVTASSGAMLAIAVHRTTLSEPFANPAQRGVRFDPLTGLPDRDALMDRLRSMLNRAAVSKQRFAVLFIDVDEFKQVNDRFGHLIGDEVLREVARRLVACVRSGDHLARFGGDEFVVLVDGIGSSGGGVRVVVNRIRAAFKRSFALPDAEVQMSVSIGVAEPSATSATAEDLLHAADRAMYEAKRREAPSPVGTNGSNPPTA
ncbi:MAG TPA: sensor domain-containing diguanylate cyclase [Lacipirellulaceae bacterium]